MKMGIKVLEFKLTSVNKCVEVEHLRGSIDQGTLMYSQRLSMAREPTTDDCKSQGTQSDSRFQSQNKWSEVDGMKSTGMRALRHLPSISNTRYSAKLYNVEGIDHKVHEPVTIPRMANIQSQDNWGMADSGFNFLRTRASRRMVIECRQHRLNIQNWDISTTQEASTEAP